METEEISVARLMVTETITVSTDTVVEDAAQKLRERDIGSLMIVDEDNQLKGILTATDFVKIVAKSNPKAETPVERYMSEDVITVGPTDTIADSATLMLDNDIQHLPVTDPEEGLIGMLSSTDLTMYLSDNALSGS